MLARWQEFVGTGELFRNLESKVSWLRDRITNAIKGKPQQAERVTVAVESGLQTLILEHAEAAAERAEASWRSVAAGAQVLEEGNVDLSRASRDFRARSERMVRDWQSGVLDLVRTAGGDKRTTARFLAYGVNGLSVALMVVVFASTGGVTGAEVGIAGGSAVVGQKLLEAVFGDQAVRRLAEQARADLATRVGGADGRGAPAVPRPPRHARPAHRLRRAAARARASRRRPALRHRAERFVSGLVAGAKKVPRKIFGREAASARRPGRRPRAGGGGRLADGSTTPWSTSAAAVVERAGARLRLSADHTVVALAGATGSGKSSTFNALCGLDLAAVGVRRPTTSWATACVWGRDPAAELLEWLEIPERHRVLRDSMLDSGQQDRALDGLVLLDLPDHDSTEVSHHLEVDRLIGMTDLMVWVLDPQKYADAAVHDRFLRPMASHKDVMLVVRQPHRRGARGPATEHARRRTPTARGGRSGRRARAGHLGDDGRGHRRAAHCRRQAGQRQGVGPHPPDR